MNLIRPPTPYQPKGYHLCSGKAGSPSRSRQPKPWEEDVKHRINGCPVNLSTLADDELERLIEASSARQSRVAQEQDLLVAERVRRAPAYQGSSAELEKAC